MRYCKKCGCKLDNHPRREYCDKADCQIRIKNDSFIPKLLESFDKNILVSIPKEEIVVLKRGTAEFGRPQGSKNLSTRIDDFFNSLDRAGKELSIKLGRS